MIHVVMNENVLVKAFDPFQFVDCDFDTYTRRLHQFAVMCPEQARDLQHQYQNLHVHYVGTFDEVTGIITYDASNKMFDLASDIAQLDALRRQATDGGVN